MIKSKLLGIGVSAVLAWGAVLSATPAVIESYGDSLTVGFLSNTDVTSHPPLSLIGQIYTDIAKWKIEQDPKYIAPYTKPENSWPVQLANQMAGAGPAPVVYNRAVSGSRSADLLKQVQSLTAPDGSAIAFFFMGHNDLCTPSTDTVDGIANNFQANYDRAIAEWDARHHDTTAYIIPVGDIHRVFAQLDGYVWHRGFEDSDLSCYDSWTRLFPYCPRYAHMQEKGKLEGYLKPRLDAMNARLATQVIEWNRKSVSGNRFVYLDGIQNQDYQTAYFAVDCFHLSSQGQRALSEAIYHKIND
jgi:lysophospholipase L1-like esterase